MRKSLILTSFSHHDFISWHTSHLETELSGRHHQQVQLFLHGNISLQRQILGNKLDLILQAASFQVFKEDIQIGHYLNRALWILNSINISRLPITSESLRHMLCSQPSSGGDSGRNTQSAPQAKALTRAK